MRVPRILFLLLILSACATQPTNSSTPRAATLTPEIPTQATATVEPTATVLPFPRAGSPTLTPTIPPPPFAMLAPSSNLLLQLDDLYHAIDLNSGADITWNVSFGTTARSNDGNKIAAIETRGETCESFSGGSSCYAAASVLHIIDTRTWHDVKNAFPANGWIGTIAFNSDATRVALAFNHALSSTLLLADSNSAQFVAQRALDWRPSRMSFANDGKTLAVYGQAQSDHPGMSKPPPPQVLALDATTLQSEWQQPLVNIASGVWCEGNCDSSHEQIPFANWNPAVVPAKDGSKLYVVHADADKLTTVDFIAHTVQTSDLRAARGGIEDWLAPWADVAEAKGGDNGAFVNAALAPDGTHLLTIRQTMSATWDAKNNFWGSLYALGDLQVVDVTNGHVVATRSLTNRGDTDVYLNGLWLTPDRSRVYVVQSTPNNDWWTDVFDAQNLQPVTRLDKWRVVGARRLDGQPVLVAQQPNATPFALAVLDPRTFAVLRTFSLGNQPMWINP